MSHDFNGRVGPPRCAECNAPLSSDERRLDSDENHYVFCLDCQAAIDSFPAPSPRRPVAGRQHLQEVIS